LKKTLEEILLLMSEGFVEFAFEKLAQLEVSVKELMKSCPS